MVKSSKTKLKQTKLYQQSPTVAFHSATPGALQPCGNIKWGYHPKTNSLPLKIDGWNMKFPFGAKDLFSKDVLVSGSVTGNIMIFTTRLYRVQNLLDKPSLTSLGPLPSQTTILVIEATCSQRHRLIHPLKLQHIQKIPPKKKSLNTHQQKLP